jgi:DNA-binding CsgD family transcriptional regulator
MIFSFTTGRLLSQTTVFSQGFSSSTSVLSYVNLFPNSGQFDAISSAGTSSTSISSGALRFTRGSGNTSFTRSTNFSPTLTALVYKFDITISGTPTGNTGSAATFQVGSSYNILTNNVEPDANTYAMLSVDFRGTSNFRFRDASNGNTSSNYSVGTTYSVTWAMNNSGSPLTYTAPNGSSETVGNDRADIWVGTTRIWNEANVETSGGALTDLKFAFTQSTGNISIDNINIYSINPFITTQPASVSVCAGGTASFSTAASGTSLSYQWKKNGANLTNGGNISGATTASLTINPVTIADADIYSVDVTSSGGYTASSNNATLTVAPVPTITSSATANAVCNSSSAQNSGLSYSATTGSPTHYSITWDGTALAAGLVNVSSTLLPASPITIPVAAGVAAATYNGTLIVSNASCSNTGNAFTLTINPLPTITGTLNLCTGATTQLNGSGVPAGSTPWVSATTGVATVNSTGLVSRVSNGTSVITYTNNSGCSQSATVSVNTPPGALSMSPSATSTCNGTVKSITVTNYQNNSPQTNSSGPISLTIPDNLSSGAASTISVSGIPADAVITGISVNFNISHTYDNDLVLNLKAPTSTLPSLMNGGKDFCEWSRKDELLYATLRKPLEAVLGRDSVGFADCALCESKFEKGEDISERMLSLVSGLGEVQRRGTPDMEFAIIGLLARMQISAGRAEEARQSVESLRARFAEAGQTRFLPNMDAMLCRIALRLGDDDAVETWYRDMAPKDVFRLRVMWRYQYMTRAMVEISHGDCDQAMLVIAPLLPYCEKCGRKMDGINLDIITAICRWRRRDGAWRASLGKALDACMEYRFIRPAAEYGAALLPLLNECGWNADAPFMEKIVAATRAQAVCYPNFLRPPQTLAEPLSAAEMQVLRLLCSNRSNQEIGETLNISLNTVKTHVSHILQKLEVSRRGEAKDAAEKLRLL